MTDLGYKIRNFQNEDQTINNEIQEMFLEEDFNFVYPEIDIVEHFSDSIVREVCTIACRDGTNGVLIVYYRNSFVTYRCSLPGTLTKVDEFSHQAFYDFTTNFMSTMVTEPN